MHIKEVFLVCLFGYFFKGQEGHRGGYSQWKEIYWEGREDGVE